MGVTVFVLVLFVHSTVRNSAGAGRRSMQAGLQYDATDPNYAEAHDNLARLLRELGRRGDAIAHLTAALRLEPGYAETKDELRELGAAV